MEGEKSRRRFIYKNEWYNQTMISLGWAVITVDANGIITFINRGMRANGMETGKINR
jgi:hypothetical protein